MKRLNSIFLFLFLGFALAACQSERTVYDQYGNVVKESEPGVEKDIYSVMEERFDAAFSEKKNKDGVPESASARVSRYQKDIDNARTDGKRFVTKSFGGLMESSLKDKSFAESGKGFGGNKSLDISKSSAYSRDLRPDFLNDSHGIAHKDYEGEHANRRSGWESQSFDASGQSFSTNPSQYKPHTPSGYVQSREAIRQQPIIYDHRNQSKKNIEDTRRLMGRDESAL